MFAVPARTSPKEPRTSPHSHSQFSRWGSPRVRSPGANLPCGQACRFSLPAQTSPSVYQLFPRPDPFGPRAMSRNAVLSPFGFLTIDAFGSVGKRRPPSLSPFTKPFLNFGGLSMAANHTGAQLETRGVFPTGLRPAAARTASNKQILFGRLRDSYWICAGPPCIRCYSLAVQLLGCERTSHCLITIAAEFRAAV